MQNDPIGMSQEELEQRYKEVSGETERLIMDQFREMWKSGNLGNPPSLTPQQQSRLRERFELEREINRRKGQ